MKNTFKRLAGLTILATALTGFAVTPVMAEVMKFHHDLPEDSAQHAAAEKFKEAV